MDKLTALGLTTVDNHGIETSESRLNTWLIAWQVGTKKGTDSSCTIWSQQSHQLGQSGYFGFRAKMSQGDSESEMHVSQT